MSIRNAIIGGIAGLIFGIILMPYVMSQIGNNLDPMSRTIFTYSVPVLCLLAGIYIGYES